MGNQRQKATHHRSSEGFTIMHTPVTHCPIAHRPYPDVNNCTSKTSPLKPIAETVGIQRIFQDLRECPTVFPQETKSIFFGMKTADRHANSSNHDLTRNLTDFPPAPHSPIHCSPLRGKRPLTLLRQSFLLRLGNKFSRSMGGGGGQNSSEDLEDCSRGRKPDETSNL